MSSQPKQPVTRRSIPSLMAQKNATPQVYLTAYTARMAELLDAHVDVLLVGDSLGMVVYGFDSTLPVTLEMMIAHGAAVVRGRTQAAVIIDMPFGSFQTSPEQAFVNAARVMQETGADGVKIEGGEVMAPTIRFLAERGIPVLAHIGLTPQSVHQLGGYKAQGKTELAQEQLLRDAHAVADAGAFSVVLEGMMEPLAARVTEAIAIPTIGIGASAACDGQVLVVDDMLGMYTRSAKFVKRFANLRETIADAAQHYAEEVRNSRFPSPEFVYGEPARLKKDAPSDS
jgi:3-methyl-2-oxobutanoate hydroxymethyltransferase